jgi:hypothetical protein
MARGHQFLTGFVTMVVEFAGCMAIGPPGGEFDRRGACDGRVRGVARLAGASPRTRPAAGMRAAPVAAAL